MDRLLRAVLKPAPQDGTGDCPDAGVLAAFVESGLTATEQSAVETHLAGCGRCQEALSVLSHDLPEEAAAEAAVPETRWFTWVTRPRLRWLVPISAAATVAVVIFATRPLIAPESEEVFPADVVQMAQAPTPPAASPAAGVDTVREKQAAIAEKREAAGTVRRDEAAKSLVGQAQVPKESREVLADAATAGRTGLDRKPVEPAAGMMAARVASEEKRTQPTAAVGAGAPAELVRSIDATVVTVSAPGGDVRWRLGAGGRLARSGDAGASWQPQASGVTGDLLAGSAPSSDVCWIVGAAGTVLVTSDGLHWERRPFPEPVHLVAVTASDARTATVTARDGRRFETLDAGLSWSPKQ